MTMSTSIDITGNEVTHRNNVEPRNLPGAEYNGVRQRQKRIRRNSDAEKWHVTCERIKMNIIYFLLILIVVLIGTLCYALVLLFEDHRDVLEPSIDEVEYDPELPVEQRVWYDNALSELRTSIDYEPNENKAKNVILFVGDGMGLSTVTASRIYKYGEEGRLSWEKFPHFGLLKVSAKLCELNGFFPFELIDFRSRSLFEFFFFGFSRHIVWISKSVIRLRLRQRCFVVRD